MWNTDRIVAVAGLILTAVVYTLSRDIGPLGRIFVDSVLVALGMLSLLLLAQGFIRSEKIRFFDSRRERNNILMGVGILALYLFFLPRIGFLLSSFVFFLAFTLYLTDDLRRIRNWIVAAVVSFFFVFGFYWVFKSFLGVPLPSGSWLLQS